MVDTGSRETAAETLAAIRRWDDGPIHTITHSHGHIDHTWGGRLLDQEADARGLPRARIIAHRNVLGRLARYGETHGLNSIVMGRQFNTPGYAFPSDHPRPDQVHDEGLDLTVGGVELVLVHGRGDTDAAAFVWLPQKRIPAGGDFVIGVFPNAGNPRNVQRFAPDWAIALRRMRALDPEFAVRGIWHLYAGWHDGNPAISSRLRQPRLPARSRRSRVVPRRPAGVPRSLPKPASLGSRPI